MPQEENQLTEEEATRIAEEEEAARVAAEEEAARVAAEEDKKMVEGNTTDGLRGFTLAEDLLELILNKMIDNNYIYEVNIVSNDTNVNNTDLDLDLDLDLRVTSLETKYNHLISLIKRNNYLLEIKKDDLNHPTFEINNEDLENRIMNISKNICNLQEYINNSNYLYELKGMV